LEEKVFGILARSDSSFPSGRRLFSNKKPRVFARQIFRQGNKASIRKEVKDFSEALIPSNLRREMGKAALRERLEKTNRKFGR